MYMTPEELEIILNNIMLNPQQVEGYAEAILEAYNRLYYEYAIYDIE